MSIRPLYFLHASCLEHDPRAHIPMHPDTPERLVAIEAEMHRREWLGFERRFAPAAQERELRLVHTAAHIEAIKRLCLSGGGVIDADTAVGEASFRAARHAAGAACEMTRALLSGESRLAFCGVRPSGHHAERARAMGFCLFNNVAIAAELALAELGARRVFVFDFDVHHGNGTANAFRDRSEVLFVSIHQEGIYPGTGALRDVGTGGGLGSTINLPVPAGSGEELWLALTDRVVLPAARSFTPDLVLLSAGFDAHLDDPLADCTLQPRSYAQLACRIRDLADEVGAPLGAVLEGGYSHRATAESAASMLAALAGEGEVESSSSTPSLACSAASFFRQYWPL